MTSIFFIIRLLTILNTIMVMLLVPAGTSRYFLVVGGIFYLFSGIGKETIFPIILTSLARSGSWPLISNYHFVDLVPILTY